MSNNNNILNIDGETIVFQHNIENILQIQDIVIVLLDVFSSTTKEDKANNVYGVKKGKIIWRVEDARNYLENCPFSFSYTLMRQIDNHRVMLTDFNGFRFMINAQTGKIIPNDSPVSIEEE